MAPLRGSGRPACARIPPYAWFALLVASCSPATAPDPPLAVDGDFEPASFVAPPMSSRPYVRWWWPGGAVDEPELSAEIASLAAVGFGGVEVQPFLIGIPEAEVAADASVRTVGTPAFFAKLATAAQAAERAGLGFDVTLGSGWPGGGPFVKAPERELLVTPIALAGPSSYAGPLPDATAPYWVARSNSIINAIGPFSPDAPLFALTAAQPSLLDASALGTFSVLAGADATHALPWSVPDGAWQLFAHRAHATGHFVVGGAYPGAASDALVVDHLDAKSVYDLIESYASPMLDAAGPAPIGALFVDSFELVGELPWTAALGARFVADKNYDPTPYLPLLHRADGESKYLEIVGGSRTRWSSRDDASLAVRVREDYEDVRGRLFLDATVGQLAHWARPHGVALRLQAHGGYADFLDAYARADIPESEALYAGGSYDFLKLASSAGHVLGRAVISSESFVSTAPGGPRQLGVDDFAGLANRAFAAGITRLVHHGYPYRRMLANGSRWYPFVKGAAGSFAITSFTDEDHPAWPSLPALNTAFARTSYAVSRGKPHAEVAWLEAKGGVPDRVALNTSGYTPDEGLSDMALALRQAGLTWDRVSRAQLTASSAQSGTLGIGFGYRALLLTELDAAEPALLDAVARAVAAGVPVFLVGTPPSRAPGWTDHDARDAKVRAAVAALLPHLHVVARPTDASAALLAAGLAPRVARADGEPMDLALVERDLAHGAIYFLANEADVPRTERIAIRDGAPRAYLLDPDSGAISPAVPAGADGSLAVDITVLPRRGLVIYARKD